VQSIRRVVSGLVMALAVIGILAALAGVVAVWVVKAGWTSQAAAVIEGLGAELQDAGSALRDVGPRLAASRQNLDAISASAGGVGEKLGEPRVVELAQGVQGRLSEIDGKVLEVNGRLTQVEAGVNNVLELANKLPGVEMPALDVKLLDGVSGLLADANDRLKVLADEATGGKVTVTQEMAGIERTVQQVREELTAAESSVTAAGARLAATQDALKAWAGRLPDMFQRAAVALTVGLVWFIAGQAGLFMWMRSIYLRAGAADESA
jgi:hypothetical protein